ncbi:MAG: hypothetical protein DYH03_13520 [Nitrospira sp. NTP1]|nr:hypothetical protein [Nitrospira sp. NTP1]
MRRVRYQMMSNACQSLRLWKSWLVGLTCLLLVACSAASPLIPIGEGPLGTVALERLASRGTTARYGSPQSAFQASHPAAVSAAVTSRFLSGLSVSGLDRPGAAQRQERYPLFTQEETEFLTPLVVRALSQAGPDQRVRFTLQDDGLITQGTLYLHKTTLRVSLSHYRASQGQSDTRPAALTLSFTPSEALVRDDVPQSWMIIEPEHPRVAVSLDALNQLPAAVPTPTANKRRQNNPAYNRSCRLPRTWSSSRRKNSNNSRRNWNRCDASSKTRNPPHRKQNRNQPLAKPSPHPEARLRRATPRRRLFPC